MFVPLKGAWALIFGVSSGMGKETARALADAGTNIIGVHFDLSEGQQRAEQFAKELGQLGVEARFFNRNIAAKHVRAELIPIIGDLTSGIGPRVVLHSVAYGTLTSFLPAPDGVPGPDGGEQGVTEKQLTMTVDVMGHSLLYWTQDLLKASLLPRGAKIFAMTSVGGNRVVRPSYAPVSTAKAVLEAHVRQLAVELAPWGVAVNAIRAGTTITPALQKIPGSERMIAVSREINPGGRLTRAEDVAEAIVTLSASDSSWLTGNVIGVDGGEALVI